VSRYTTNSPGRRHIHQEFPVEWSVLVTTSMQVEQVNGMRLFHFPGGLHVWNSNESGTGTQFWYREIVLRRNCGKQCITAGDRAVILDVEANVGMSGLSLMERFASLRLLGSNRCRAPMSASNATSRSQRADRFTASSPQPGTGQSRGRGTDRRARRSAPRPRLFPDHGRKHVRRAVPPSGCPWLQ
jgi:hypothetical protein